MQKTSLFLATILLITKFTLAQVSFSLSENIQEISPKLIGINGRSTEGPSWTDPEFIDLIQQLSPGTVRYPAGTQANYWDWHTGTFIENVGKTSDYTYSIKMLIDGLPEETSIVYVVNLARPTPSTGVSFEASEEILKSDETLQLKINDMLAALSEFENRGKLPEAVELGNEFYFDSEHGAIYAVNPNLYISHSKEIAKQIKTTYPTLKILLITTKGGTTSRDFWNNTIFNALAEDSEFKSNIHAVVQHHYINDSYGNLTQVTNEATAQTAILEGFIYTREKQSDYDLIPDGISLWLTEYGVTKQTADNTWASGLLGVAMSLGWLEKGEKIERLIYHHITDDPEIINKTEMKLGAVGMAYGLLAKAALEMTHMQKITISNNPIISNNVEALHAFKFKNKNQENVFILNLGNQSYSDVNLSNLFSYFGQAEEIKYWNTAPYTRPTYEGLGIDSEINQISETQITIKPYSVTLVSVKNESTGFNTTNFSDKFQVYPSVFNSYLNVKIDTKLINSELELINTYGQTVYHSKIQTKTSTHFPKINKGIYIARLTSGNKTYNSKILKIK